MWRILDVAMLASLGACGAPRIPVVGFAFGRDRWMANVILPGGVLAGGRCRHSTCWNGRNRIRVDRGCSGIHCSRGRRGISDRPTRCLNRFRPAHARMAALRGWPRCAGQSEVSRGCFRRVRSPRVVPRTVLGSRARASAA